MKQSNIRNFSIIAHIDHGKSTLADRLLEATHTVEKRQMKAQLLDAMDLERERGITIKLNFVQLHYQAQDGEEYVLHLIDTPGHVDFSYEVSRSLAACEGAILVVDAAQGIEAQTLANVYLAMENDLEIIPVINKIDLPSAQPEVVKEEIENVIGLDTEGIPLISAKNAVGIEDVLEAIVKQVPAPQGDRSAPLQALVFDSLYDAYKGVIVSVCIKNGSVKVGDDIRFMANDAVYEVTEVGVYAPNQISKEMLVTGEVGYLTASIKSIKDVGVGDTITSVERPATESLMGYRELPSMVFCGLYPVESSKYTDLRDGLEKLVLNDSSLRYEPETSQALGFGFRCGFLGLLHMDVVQERLEREYGIELISTAPSVIFQVTTTDGKMIEVENPSQIPDQQMIEKIEEPFVKAEIIVPNEYIGVVMELCQKKRGEYINMEVLDANRMNIIYELPLVEIVYDFFDQLKSQTKGYASLDYQLIGYRSSKLVKMDILLNGEVVDALSVIVHRDFAQTRGRSIVEKMRKLIPRHQFQIPIQAAIGSKIIARADISALRKNVLAKCYGGDITRKKKLLEKQKEGKKRMKQVGRVEVPQEAFMSVLAMDDD
ncbi:MAG TPA: elongation factor 4 [Erysipelothrix sp.]|nr:elongation factor 4 [Erysipelothrix sp.]